MTDQKLSSFLTKMRESRGLSREQLAGLSKLSLAFICSLESGRDVEKVPLRTLHSVFAALKLTAEEFLQFAELSNPFFSTGERLG